MRLRFQTKGTKATGGEKPKGCRPKDGRLLKLKTQNAYFFLSPV